MTMRSCGTLVQLHGLAHLRVVPHQHAIGHLVNEPFVAQVVPAEDEHAGRDAERSRALHEVGLREADADHRRQHERVRTLRSQELVDVRIGRDGRLELGQQDIESLLIRLGNAKEQLAPLWSECLRRIGDRPDHLLEGALPQQIRRRVSGMEVPDVITRATHHRRGGAPVVAAISRRHDRADARLLRQHAPQLHIVVL